MISIHLTILVFALIFLMPVMVLGQEIERNPQAAYFEVGKEDSVKEWLVIGPFPRKFETDFLKSYGGEDGIRPYEGMTITTPDGKNYTWKRYRSQYSFINLQDAIGKHENAIAYAACNILGSKPSSKDQRLEMVLYGGECKIWINSQLVRNNPINTPWQENRFEIFVNEGSNRCLVKVGAEKELTGFTIQVLDYESYRRSLRLNLTVQRQKPDGRDVLNISGSRMPKSAVWKLPSLPVSIEIRGEASICWR